MTTDNLFLCFSSRFTSPDSPSRLGDDVCKFLGNFGRCYVNMIYRYGYKPETRKHVTKNHMNNSKSALVVNTHEDIRSQAPQRERERHQALTSFGSCAKSRELVGIISNRSSHLNCGMSIISTGLSDFVEPSQ